MISSDSSSVGVEFLPESNTPVIYKNIAGKKVYYSSRYRPCMEAQRLLSGHQNEYNGILFLIGGGNLCLLEFMCAQLRFEMLIVIEPDDEVVSIIQKICTDRIAHNQREKIHFFDKEHWELQTTQLFQEYPYHRARIFVNRAQAQLDMTTIHHIRERVVQAYDRKMINANTLDRFEKVWLRNLTKNTKFIGMSTGIESLFGVMNHFAAVIIGAGPSLTNHIDILRVYQDQMCLIAVDTVTKTLHKNGIFPHIVVVIDPQKVNARYVENLELKSIQNTIFICEPAICNSALRDKHEKIVCFDTFFPYYVYLSKFFSTKGDLDLGGSVANAAYDVAIKLGFSQVSFVGLDMCYTQDSYHVQGSMYEENWFSTATRLQPYESLRQTILDLPDMQKNIGLLGDVVYLDSKFLMFINWFVERQRNKKHSTEFYNCTEGGYPIEGIPNITFGEFIKLLHLDQPFSLLWQKVLRNIQMESQKQIEQFPLVWDKLKNSLHNICDQIEQYKKIAWKGKILVKQALVSTKNNQPDVQQKMQQLNHVDEQLMKNFEGKEFINMALQKAIRKVMKETGETPSLQQTLDHSCMIYEDIIAACDMTIRHLETVFV